MIALIQRVNYASVAVEQQTVAKIGSGLLVFIGVEKTDTSKNANDLFEKIRKFRIFSDSNGKINVNIEQVGADILLVPQFTLPAQTTKGNRPGFDPVAAPEIGLRLFNELVEHFQNKTTLTVETGVFKAHMRVLLENDGPLTFWLQK